MSNIKEDIQKIYQQELQNCYNEIKRILASFNDSSYVTKNIFHRPNLTTYIVEIVAPHITNSDDYGVVVDIALEEENDIINCHIDLLKTTGSFYFHKIIEIKLDDNGADLPGLKESLDCMKSLPPLAVEVYRRDYGNSFSAGASEENPAL